MLAKIIKRGWILFILTLPLDFVKINLLPFPSEFKSLVILELALICILLQIYLLKKFLKKSAYLHPIFIVILIYFLYNLAVSIKSDSFLHSLKYNLLFFSGALSVAISYYLFPKNFSKISIAYIISSSTLIFLKVLSSNTLHFKDIFFIELTALMGISIFFKYPRWQILILSLILLNLFSTIYLSGNLFIFGHIAITGIITLAIYYLTKTFTRYNFLITLIVLITVGVISFQINKDTKTEMKKYSMWWGTGMGKIISEEKNTNNFFLIYPLFHRVFREQGITGLLFLCSIMYFTINRLKKDKLFPLMTWMLLHIILWGAIIFEDLKLSLLFWSIIGGNL